MKRMVYSVNERENKEKRDDILEIVDVLLKKDK